MSDELPTKKLPVQIAAAWDKPEGGMPVNPDDLCLLADESPDGFASNGGWTEVGIYKLVETVRVRSVAKIERRKKK